MLICLCYGVSDRHVRQMLKEGAHSIEQIQAKLKVGSNCGSCLCEVEQIIAEERGSENQAASPIQPAANCSTPLSKRA